MFSPGMIEVAQMVIPIAPLLGVSIVGLVFAATHRRRAPQAAALVFAAVCLMIFALVAQRVVYFLVPRMLMRQGWTPEDVRWTFTISGFITSSLSAAGVFLLILAAFAGRHRED
jgi:hypothetical protein